MIFQKEDRMRSKALHFEDNWSTRKRNKENLLDFLTVCDQALKSAILGMAVAYNRKRKDRILACKQLFDNLLLHTCKNLVWSAVELSAEKQIIVPNFIVYTG